MKKHGIVWLLAGLILLSAVIMLPSAAMAAVGMRFSATNADGVEIWYEVTSEGGNANTVQVSKHLTPAAIDTYLAGTLTIPQTVALGRRIYTVTAIDAYAFNGCNNLSHFIFPPD